jgi:hypothetical protein
MPRYERIPRITATTKDIEELKTANFQEGPITVNRLRDAKLDFHNIDEVALAFMKRKLPDDSRTKEIMESVSRIELVENYEELFSFLSSRIGADATSALIRKLKSKKHDLYKDVLIKLTAGYNEIFMDNAIMILGNEFHQKDISDDIIHVLMSNKIRDPLDFSSLLMILGKSNDSRHLNFLYSYYTFFKDNFPEEEYFEGPLVAIKDIVGVTDQ